jgi:hypothetical protein
MKRNIVSTEGHARSKLRQFCEDFVNDLWIPAHLSPEQAAEFAMDYFKRTVLMEMKLLAVSTE